MMRSIVTHRRVAVIAGAAVIGLGFLACGTAVSAAPAPTQIELKLYDAAWQKGNEQPKGGAMLLLFLVRSGERWEQVLGVAGDLNTALQLGLVEQGTVSDQAIDLTVTMNISGDNYVPGGPADYKIALKAKGGGAFEGTYSGTFRGAPAQGRAEARILPPSKQYTTYPEPIAPGEHPRILFRKSDLAALREKAKTPLGQAALKADDAITLGIQYQLTGDKKYAEQAREIVERMLNCNFKDAKTPGSHHGIFHYGYVWEHPAVAYDLCYDAWDEAFKKRIERYLMTWAERILWQRGMFNTQGQYTYGNGEAGSLYYGVALGALTFLGEKGPEPAPPAALDPIAEVPPAADYQPGKDVPVVPLEPGKSPAKWLAAGPVRAIIAADPLRDAGGVEKCRPTAGTAFTFEGVKYEFKPLAPEFVPPAGGVYLNVGKSVSPGHVKRGPGPEMVKDAPLTLCLYSVLDNAEPRLVKVRAGGTRFGSQQLVLNGHTLADGQVVKLQKGLYPMLVVMRVRTRWDSLQPKLDGATEQDFEASKAVLARFQEGHARALKDWQHDMAEWKRTGGWDQDYQRMFEVTRYLMFLQFREGVGTGGAQSVTSAESYELGLHPAMYASAYRICFGRDLSPWGDISHALPRRVFAHVYPDKGEPVTHEIHGPTGIGPDYFAYNFPIVPEEWKPAVLWAWNRSLGITGKADAGKAVSNAKWYVTPRAFVNYPLDMEPKPPKGVMPLTWEAPDFGYYGFRNGWEGKDDFLVQVWLKSNRPKGYYMPNAGTFRIMGLGHQWNMGYPTVRLDNKRCFDPVVMLPEDQINDAGRALTSFVKMEKDGSGVLTADMNEIYCRKLGYGAYGNVRKETTFEDSGIQGLRAYAVDYSGASGAPCLFVLVDKITGGKSKVWPWYLADVSSDKVSDAAGDFKNVKVQGNTVTVAKPDGATMKMTFIGPADPQIKAGVRTLKFQQTYNRGEAAFTAPGIFANGADGTDGNFFVVVTIQKGEGPEVKAVGKGLDARATVGRRTVAFDGRKIVLGNAGPGGN